MQLGSILKALSENPALKKKLIKASIVFGIFITVILLSIIFLANESNSSSEDFQDNKITGNYIKADSTNVVKTEKNMVYENFGVKSPEDLNADYEVINGLSGGKIAEAEVESSNEDVSNYIKGREASLRAMQSENSNRPTISRGSTGRRSYNSNGNSSDWTVSNTENRIIVDNSDIENYSQNRYTPQPSSNIPTISSSSSGTSHIQTQQVERIPTKDEKLSALEEKRLKLRSGSRNIENTKNIKINIDGSQSIKYGQNVRLKIMQDCFISNTFVQKGTIAYGQSSFGQDRLMINISSINVKGQIVQCYLEGYGTDGLKGIAVNMQNLEGLDNIAKNEATSRIGTGTILSNVISSLLSSKRSEVKVKVLNNQNLIFIQN